MPGRGRDGRHMYFSWSERSLALRVLKEQISLVQENSSGTCRASQHDDHDGYGHGALSQRVLPLVIRREISPSQVHRSRNNRGHNPASLSRFDLPYSSLLSGELGVMSSFGLLGNGCNQSDSLEVSM